MWLFIFKSSLFLMCILKVINDYMFVIATLERAFSTQSFLCCRFGQHVCSAAEHIQLYLDRSDRAVVGAATYCSLHELIDRLEMSNLLQTEVSSKNFDSSSSAKNTRQIADETQSESGPQQSSLVQQTC